MSGQRSACAPPITIDARWILTMDGPPIVDGRVVVEEGRIRAVGGKGDLAVVGRHIALGESVLMPGLVNAHCHLELSAYHGALAPGDFWEWLNGLIRLRLEPGAAGREQAAVAGAVESMLHWGTTCVGDISRSAWVATTLRALPIRKVCYVELISGAMSPPANIEQLTARLDALPEDDPLFVPGISPHAPYTVARDDLSACLAIARRRGWPVAMHLGETREEIEWLGEGTGRIAEWHRASIKSWPKSPGMGPARYALSAGLCPAALIHMNYADDWRELGSLPEGRRAVVVYCPRSHRFFGHSTHPFREMLAGGLRVALGTDSSASHDGAEAQPVSVLDEVRWLGRQYPEARAEDLLAMATVHGAAALGLGGRIGRIAAGMEGDLVGFGVGSQAAGDPAGEVVRQECPPGFVCIGGIVRKAEGV